MNRNHWLYQTPIAHRGLHRTGVPENSIPAFLAAADHHYGIELDVRLTQDGEIVVFHDAGTYRMTGQRYLIQDATLSELSALCLSDTACKIPRLVEVLDAVNGRVPIVIEIKNTGKAGKLEETLHAILKNYDGEFAVASFDPFSLQYFKKHSPQMLRGQIASHFKGEALIGTAKLVLRNLMLNSLSSPDFISYNIHDLPNKQVEKARKRLCVLGWVVRNAQDMQIAKKYCDNIIFENMTP
ncbi:MAG: glycerophosphodiester phosphodiesterase [Oscillospiraceae bacterium]|nr:glycerophosphodiester phosphodiesterase [Oscillospiraceae bacterium]